MEAPQVTDLFHKALARMGVSAEGQRSSSAAPGQSRALTALRVVRPDLSLRQAEAMLRADLPRRP
ncbi:hypothetical protein F11_08610 [Rhodospirillum rubrum F11]|uniref:Uncharacterized protein n=1 Tax=Rhodospirillum rubrum (strain ATCC 11170 / ATH 1.1.1 / DSM 467 / LMG 4362 / NCIMB 8255 / S1) TaxID=269796 RepID=Q2RTS5_RHORT|nr:hypothetical protein Rru_A1670 [Rhodospirillum rubrum ATCC 11170]AEO48188.1 hypothetical protein F11_08610 [Rhodospirillum rubrum F11]MBK5954053.1 hypothetical protein [Rhodospirillum rubrum]QXG82103.1 hypothetical protein KUL73_08655 [Rhodospirillum rubrum]HAQ00385.1 hypothetical protein [Rhodospirillum rubrum]